MASVGNRSGRRIFWKHDEASAVAKEYARLRGNDPLLSKVDAVRRAQKILPTERQRQYLSIAALKNFWIAANVAEREAAKAPQAPPTNPADNYPVIPEVVKVSVPVVVPTTELLKATPTALLIAQLWERFASWADAANRSWLGAAGKTPVVAKTPEPPTYPTFAAPRVADAKKLPRVAIVGLLPGQYGNVEAQVNGKVDVVWIDKDWSKTKYPPSVDYIICTRHIQHRWTEAAKLALPSERVFWCEGLTEIVNRLYSIASVPEGKWAVSR